MEKKSGTPNPNPPPPNPPYNQDANPLKAVFWQGLAAARTRLSALCRVEMRNRTQVLLEEEDLEVKKRSKRRSR